MEAYPQIDFNELDLEDLVNYITQKHHAYCKQMLPVIFNNLYAVKIEKGKVDAGFKLVFQCFTDFGAILEQHLRKEEYIIFPFLKKVIDSKCSTGKAILAQVSMVENPLRILQAENEKLVSLLSIMRYESRNYQVPKNCSVTYKICYNDLYEFEQEFHKLIFMEEKFLFPKILQLKKHASFNYQTKPH